MRSIARPLAAALVLVLLPAAAGAQDSPTPGGFRSDWISNFDEVTRKATELAGAIPGETMAWRPAEGIRSCGQVIAHMAVANYFLPSFLGHEVPQEISRQLEQETDPDLLRQRLAESIAHLRGIVAAMSDETLEERVKIFGGREVSTRELLLIALGHAHEHVGQLVAYARSNGIVPPWSASDG
jgi:uncharacterized damage-inducible protein DinB